MNYWDYLGWRDTLARPANSERQRQYARMRGDGGVYTPQMVVDGFIHVNGRDEEAIETAIEAAAVRLARVKVSVKLRAEGDTLVIEILARRPRIPKNARPPFGWPSAKRLKRSRSREAKMLAASSATIIQFGTSLQSVCGRARRLRCGFRLGTSRPEAATT
jgi:uncharacterized protein DUF1223